MTLSTDELSDRAHAYKTLTPMMRQYCVIKSQYDDCILFYRMGDFYEMFFDDAILAAEKLDIALTKRGKMGDVDIPMCGVPFHSSDVYLQKLVKLGHKIAICEQLETPEEARKRGYKALVRREVVRIITPGTILEENLLSSKEENNLCCLYVKPAQSGVFEHKVCISWIDITIGILYTETITKSAIAIEIARLSPKEIIISEKILAEPEIKKQIERYNGYITLKAANLFEFHRCEARLKVFYKVHFLSGILDFSDDEVISIGVLLDYIEHTQKSNVPIIRKIERVLPQHFMSIDYATRINLELEKSQFVDKKNTLLGVLDKTLTAAGARLLRSMFSSPLADHNAIRMRLDNVEFFLNNVVARDMLRDYLKDFPDLERIISRISTNRGRPIDLLLVKTGLEVLSKVFDTLLECSCSAGIRNALSQIGSLGNVRNDIRAAVQHDITNDKVEYASNNIIRIGYRLDLDNLYKIKFDSDKNVEELRLKYQKVSGVQNLRIVKNNLMGFFIEITPSNSGKMSNPIFFHRQTLGSAIRYTTDELKQLEGLIASIDVKIQSLEIEILNELYKKVLSYAEQINISTHSIAIIDVASALAEVAFRNKYIKPIVDDSTSFAIKGGRHPTVEMVLKEKFHPNDCILSNDHTELGDVSKSGDAGHDDNLLLLITGPNMAGKSTFLRQNALICIMAQIGSFVPAEYAKIGVVDKLFSRIGSGDNINYGQSTFMIEMLETAYILNNATGRSFIILDEIGRGTSTYDGLAIAWAVMEEIHNLIKARTLFATHYHELTQLEEKLPRLICYTPQIKNWDNNIIFMYEMVRGKAAQSYGINVARSAGISENVLGRANQILELLTSGNAGKGYGKR